MARAREAVPGIPGVHATEKTGQCMGLVRMQAVPYTEKAEQA